MLGLASAPSSPQAVHSSNVPTSTLKRGGTTCKSLLDMNRRKHKETGHTALLLALWPSCSIVSSSLTADDLIHCWVAANACSAEPCRCLAFTASPESQCISSRSKTFNLCLNNCVVESLSPRVSEPSEPCVLIDDSSSCLSAHVQLDLLSFHHIRVNPACSRCCRHRSSWHFPIRSLRTKLCVEVVLDC